MSAVFVIAKRDLKTIFSTASTGVFFAAYVMLSGYLMCGKGGFFDRAAADMASFFTFQPLLLTVFIPALTMRAFAEEYRTGTMDLLNSLPFSVVDLVCGKFLAICMTAATALILTFPVWFSVTRMGNPDNGVILTGYLVLWVTACAYAAVGLFCSVCTTHQTAAFIGTVCLCVLMTNGMTFAEGLLSQQAAFWGAAFSFQPRFDRLFSGIVNVPDMIFFLSFIVLFLFLTGGAIDLRKGKTS